MKNISSPIATNQSSSINDVEHLESLYPADSRKKEIDKILSHVKDGNSCQLIAMPGVGKANLLGFLAYNRNVRIQHVGEKEQIAYHFVLCNFSEIRNRPLIDVIKFMFLELVSSLHARRREEEFGVVNQLFKDALSYKDELVLFQALKKAVDYLTLEKDMRLIFLLERFESYIPTVTADFFTNLRSMRSHAKHKFTVVFSLTRPLEDVLEPTTIADFYEFVADHHIYLPLEDKEGFLFQLSHVEKLTGKKLSEETVKEILALTAGHGKLTRLALEIAFSHTSPIIAGEEKDSGPDFANATTDEQAGMAHLLLSQKVIQGALLEIWYFLTPDEQQDILTLCQGESCPIPNTFLQDIGLIQQEKIAIPLFQMFVQERMQPETKETHITFDVATNMIKKGSLILSDNLTISEYRLLRFLLDHAGTIIDREQIIQAVWTGSKSLAGVSDQAVDQLVFRLRKKIEDDPNNPIHIQTIKGRGIRFVPQKRY